jgi:hypothetical protein
VRIFWLSLLLLVATTTWFIINGKGTVSYHKRSEKNTLIFISIYNSHVIVEIKDKSNKGSLKWHEDF